MPVLQVFSPTGSDLANVLRRACAAAARALELPDDAVVATHVLSGEAVCPGREPGPWPIVVVHGSPRPPERMEQAVSVLEELFSDWSPTGEAWVTWPATRPSTPT